ncbi:MAG: DUF2782 domain-containing protein [Gammaproteobacteria bacterium]|nr:DUF2782 domain-containing protein [Gammaproteobacteria bacterium]
MHFKTLTTSIPVLALLFGLLVGPVRAADVPPPPPLPEEPQQSTDIPEPEVRIIHKDDHTIEEYSVNGQVRYIKITPSVGKPYYMVDTDGDGQVDKSFKDLDNPPVNQWILWRW